MADLFNGNAENISTTTSMCSINLESDSISVQGLTCPRCEKATMEIDAQMNMVCPNCDFILGGGFT